MIAAGAARSRLTAEVHRDETTVGGRSCSRRSLVCVGPLRHLVCVGPLRHLMKRPQGGGGGLR